jgi:hypothetical protein
VEARDQVCVSAHGGRAGFYGHRLFIDNDRESTGIGEV